MKKDIIETILTILVILVLIVIIFMLVLKVFGSVPIEYLLTALVIGLVLNEIRTGYSRGKFVGQFTEFQKNIKEGFARVREDINELEDIIKKKKS